MQQVAEQYRDKKNFGGAACFQGKEEKDSGRTYEQAMAVLDKYIADHPERWDKEIGQLAEAAFIEACEKRAKNP